MLAASTLSPKELKSQIREIHTRTHAPFGVHFGGSLMECAHIEICLQEKVTVVIFQGDNPPEAYITRLRCGGIPVWMEVNSKAAARAACEARADAIILQREGTDTLAQIISVVDAIAPVPVIVGDVREGRYVAAALALGADAVCVQEALQDSREACSCLPNHPLDFYEEVTGGKPRCRECRPAAEIITEIMRQAAETIRDRLARMT